MITSDDIILKIIVIAVILSLTISYFQLKDIKKRNIYTSILNAKVNIELNDLLTMTGREFECACSEIFKTLGYSTLITQATNDEGKDLILTKSYNRIYVECKAWDENNVGREVLQKLIGAMVADNINNGIVITTSYFTDNAREYMKKINKKTKFKLTLYDLNDIKNILKEINKSEIKNEKVIEV